MGMREGSPNICKSWIHRLLICNEAIYSQISVLLKSPTNWECDYAAMFKRTHPHLCNTSPMKLRPHSCSLCRLQTVETKINKNWFLQLIKKIMKMIRNGVISDGGITSPVSFRIALPRNPRMEESSTTLLMYWWGISTFV